MAACERGEDAGRSAVRGAAREVAPETAVCPVELDYLYSTVDRLYYEVAHNCGLSTSAFWMLYELHRANSAVSIKKLNISWSFSKQTINSALKTLEGKGLIAYAYLEGSRKNKSVSLTEAGLAFARRYIQPAIAAEGRAFFGLTEDERAAMLTTISKYATALSAEFDRARAEVAAGASVGNEVPADVDAPVGDAPATGGAPAAGQRAGSVASVGSGALPRGGALGAEAPAGDAPTAYGAPATDTSAGRAVPADAARTGAQADAHKLEQGLMQGEEGRV